MKANITISLDHELIYKLRESGGISKTINSMLQKNLFGARTKEGLENMIKEKFKEKKELEKEIKELRLKILNIPKFVTRIE